MREIRLALLNGPPVFGTSKGTPLPHSPAMASEELLKKIIDAGHDL